MVVCDLFVDKSSLVSYIKRHVDGSIEAVNSNDKKADGGEYTPSAVFTKYSVDDYKNKVLDNFMKHFTSFQKDKVDHDMLYNSYFTLHVIESDYFLKFKLISDSDIDIRMDYDGIRLYYKLYSNGLCRELFKDNRITKVLLRGSDQYVTINNIKQFEREILL